MECSSLRFARDPSSLQSIRRCCLSAENLAHVFCSARKRHRRRDSFRSVVFCNSARRHHRRRDATGFESRPKELFRHIGSSPAHESRDGGSDDGRVVVTLDMQHLKKRAETLTELAKSSMHASAARAVRLGKLMVNDGRMFLEDVRSSVAIQNDRRLVISLRRSSIEFAFTAIMGCVLLFTAWKVLMMAAKRYRWGWEESFGPRPVFKRDRSLGGREVFVGKSVARDQGSSVEKQNPENVRRTLNPLDAVESSRSEKDMVKQKESKRSKIDSVLPGWWPSAMSPSTASSRIADSGAQERASSLFKMIMEKKSIGQEFDPDDILQLYLISKYSGTSVTFDSPYTRDSFYRAVVSMALPSCGRSGNLSINFGGEKAADFFAVLAGSIQMDAERAATMVNAAVAARTRSIFLQAWALYVQGRATEAEKELVNLSYILAAFPPNDGSPEMEMVAEGLSKHLSEDERTRLLELFAKVSGASTERVAAEALGL